ncbi:MAG: hypothetical protein N2036_10285 [Bryobacteraceae bacterium]|nr:hypothetical protein [Bryobacteraceae bacterium]MCX7604449.1 hypothetical protein [Bryobacteraceae bacterium]
MGFALWLDGDLAWAQGTHEYRPMGAAVIHSGGIFTPRDFRPSLRAPSRFDPRFAGFFASLGEMNAWLAQRRKRRSQQLRKNFPRGKVHLIPPF